MLTSSNIKSMSNVFRPYGPFYMQVVKKFQEKPKTQNLITLNLKSCKSKP
jgi:hypothetical protein